MPQARRDASSYPHLAHSTLPVIKKLVEIPLT